MTKIKLLIVLLFLFRILSAQVVKYEDDKCGYDTIKGQELYKLYGDKWGYSYDSLLNDISLWQQNESITIQSIGQSTQGREIYELTISNFNITKELKHRIYIHARTHPGEVQSFWVTREIINYLSGNTAIGNYLRDHCIFHIIPMYNPDGVELELPRENANNIDLESNWDADVPEVEVMNLKNRFFQLMQEDNPVEIALNMHSAYDCHRYFVYHHENGTSVLYTQLEQDFIGDVRFHYLSGIQPYDYFISWVNGTPAYYPESWWWTNYNEQVMALTYEDMNCVAAGNYSQTAYSILYGISDYLNLGYAKVTELNYKKNQILAYPNPFKNEISIDLHGIYNVKKAIITDVSGRIIYTFSENQNNIPEINWNGKDNKGNEVLGGIYFLIINNAGLIQAVKLIKE